MRPNLAIAAMSLYYFNPRTSFEVRPKRHDAGVIADQFQSTHLIRGATLVSCCMASPFLFQSTHLIRGATGVTATPDRGDIFQSTHLIRGATVLLVIVLSVLVFQSTHLIRGATELITEHFKFSLISIHAPHSRCDGTVPAPFVH